MDDKSLYPSEEIEFIANNSIFIGNCMGLKVYAVTLPLNLFLEAERQRKEIVNNKKTNKNPLHDLIFSLMTYNRIYFAGFIKNEKRPDLSLSFEKINGIIPGYIPRHKNEVRFANTTPEQTYKEIFKKLQEKEKELDAPFVIFFDLYINKVDSYEFSTEYFKTRKDIIKEKESKDYDIYLEKFEKENPEFFTGTEDVIDVF